VHTETVVIRVGILDDHRSFGDAICLALASTPDFDCVGVTTNFERCREMLVALHPDVLLIDYQLVDTTGFECASKLRLEGLTMRIVMLTAHASSQELQSVARKYGVEQVLSKDSPLGKILTAIETGPLPAEPAEERSALPKFSRRQREVLQLMGKGMSPAEIAELLDVSIHTARRHVKDVMALLGASTQLAAVTVAYRDGHLIPSRSSSRTPD
jgi:DNA-binding NarL/FixJ family response regulator